MADLYGTSGAIAMGNMRSREVRDFNDRVKKHNEEVTSTIQGLRGQLQTATTIKEIKDQATNLWTAKDIPGKVAEYNKWRANRNATNPTQGSVRRNRTADKPATETPSSEPAPTETPPASEPDTPTTTARPSEPISEGAPNGESVSEIAETSEGSVGKVAKGIVKEGEGMVEEGVLGKAIGKIGVLGSAAQGGMDLYEDIKADKIQGNNTWEKASNVLQIGGSIADIVGTAFPPAKLLGGVLDLASGITDSVGEKLDEDKQSGDLTTEQQQDTETTETTADVERKDPTQIARTGLTAVTGAVQ